MAGERQTGPDAETDMPRLELIARLGGARAGQAGMKARAEEAEARVVKARAVIQDALHALAYGHTDVAMKRLGKALSEFGCDAENGETA